MLRRKPSKIEVKVEDKEELEEARKRSAAAAATTTTSAATGAASPTTKPPLNVVVFTKTPDPQNQQANVSTASFLPKTLVLQNKQASLSAASILPKILKKTLQRRRFYRNSSATIPTNQQENMEIEVKLRLPSSAAHQTLLSLLSPFHRHTHRQHNNFFDGAAAELSSRRAVLRFRFYGDDAKCVVSLKANAVLANGVSRVEEDEEELDPRVGRECVADPVRLGGFQSRIMDRVKNDWNGLVLEVDETLYDFGTCYEIECESVEPEKAKKLIEEFLKENGIDYCYSEGSKFAIF